MSEEGPAIDRLVHRLSDTPAAFLAAPRIGSNGEVHVAAVVGDVLLEQGKNATAAELASFRTDDTDRSNWLRLVLITCWLANDEWFLEHRDFGSSILSFLKSAALTDLAQVVNADAIATDPDRREELARLLLAHLGLRPLGESRAQAADRLNTVSTVERARVLREMKQKRVRAAQLRQEMAEKKAREAAAKYSRE